MRILMLSQFYPPVIGGEEQHVRNLGAALAARGHEVTVATLWSEGLPEREIDRGVRVERLRGTLRRASWLFSETGRRHVPPFPDPELTAGLRRMIARDRPEIVHGHNWLIHSFLPLKRWSGAKLLLTLHDFSFICPRKSFMAGERLCSGPGLVKCLNCAAGQYGRLKGAVTTVGNWGMGLVERREVDLFLPVSRAVANGNGLVREGLRHVVVPNFAPDDVTRVAGDYTEYLAQLPDEPFLLFVGDVRRGKGVDVLLKAYAELQGAPPLVLIGRECPDGPASLPANVLRFKDWPHDAVMGAWARSLVGLVPSIVPDACPTVAIEAMASGRPVVGARVGGLPDLVADGETGLLVPPDDVPALRGAIQRLLDDADLRERMGRAGLRRAPLFQATSVVSRIEAIYEDVLGAGRRSASVGGTASRARQSVGAAGRSGRGD
jgi:glycosyltransferase involved in cell wall biosynthesis